MATIPFATSPRHPISVDAFHRMGETGMLGPSERVELIAGEIVTMSPIGVLHAAIVDALTRHFARRAGESVFVRCQNPLRLDGFNEPEPDIAVVRARDDLYTTAHPGPADVLLVIEVADTSLDYDLGTKTPLYARHGIPEVWVIDAATRQTRVFRQPIGRRETVEAPLGGGGYAKEVRVGPDEALSCGNVIDDSGQPILIELARLLPPSAETRQ